MDKAEGRAIRDLCLSSLSSEWARGRGRCIAFIRLRVFARNPTSARLSVVIASNRHALVEEGRIARSPSRFRWEAGVRWVYTATMGSVLTASGTVLWRVLRSAVACVCVVFAMPGRAPWTKRRSARRHPAGSRGYSQALLHCSRQLARLLAEHDLGYIGGQEAIPT